MVKKKKSTNKVRSLDSEEAHSSKRSFIYDEVDDYLSLSNNEDSDGSLQYNDDDHEQLMELSASDEFQTSEDDDDDEFEGTLEEDIQSDAPESGSEDERALGKRKHDFFGTDLTDQRIHRTSQLHRKTNDEEAFLIEEESVRRLQERMTKQSIGLPSSDLLPELQGSPQNEKPEGEVAEILREPSLNLAPELQSMSKEIKVFSKELDLKLIPLIKAHKAGLLCDSPAIEYLEIRYFVVLNYLGTISGFMMLASSGAEMVYHPIVSRRNQFRQLLKEMEPCKARFDPVLTELVARIGDVTALSQSQAKEKKSTEKQKGKSKKILSLVRKKQELLKRNKERPATKTDKSREQFATSDNESDNEDNETEASASGVLNSHDRRPITYQMKKNKGLLPSRKKEQRNPRVKYKNKYVKKLKRRKGQVRGVRRETSRYQGEASGINMNAVKSVKLK